MPTESVSISCDDCVLSGTSACEECVVTFLLGPTAGEAIVVDVAEARAVRMLRRAGWYLSCASVGASDDHASAGLSGPWGRVGPLMGYLLVTNDFPPKVGGIQSYLYELFRRLPPEELTVLTTPTGKPSTLTAAAVSDRALVRARAVAHPRLARAVECWQSSGSGLVCWTRRSRSACRQIFTDALRGRAPRCGGDGAGRLPRSPSAPAFGALRGLARYRGRRLSRRGGDPGGWRPHTPDRRRPARGRPRCVSARSGPRSARVRRRLGLPLKAGSS